MQRNLSIPEFKVIWGTREQGRATCDDLMFSFVQNSEDYHLVVIYFICIIMVTLLANHC